MFRHRRQLIAFLAAALLAPQFAFAQTKAQKPNILLVTADDLGLQLGAYGDKTARTPRLDAFAAQSHLFERAYVAAPSCSPSRAALLTGLFPHQNGQNGLSNRGFSTKKGIENLPQLLQKNGYYNGLIGKLHIAPASSFPFDYQKPQTSATLDVQNVALQASEFLEGAGEKPFFLYVNYFDPHTPFQTQFKGLPAQPQSAENVAPFGFNGIKTPDVRKNVADYYNGVSRLDSGMGFLLDWLEKSGRAENTIVIFTGDNGPPFVRGKTSLYEAGTRSPLLIRWPKITKNGARTGEFVSLVDVMPTLLEAAKIESKTRFAGQSLTPLLRGENAKWRAEIATEYTAHSTAAYFARRAIRDERWKLIHNLLAPKPNPVGRVDGTTPTNLPPGAFETEVDFRATKRI